MRERRNSETRQRLIRAAEALIAERGIASVTTREIIEQAGQRNQSALHYHFGSTEGLIRAALVDQMERIDERRVELLRMASATDIPAVMRAIILPVAEDSSSWKGGRNHLSLLSQYVHSPAYDYDEVMRQSRLPGICDAMNRIWEAIPPLASHMRMLRYRTTFSAALTALVLWSHSEKPSHATDFTEGLIATTFPMLCGERDSEKFICWPKETTFRKEGTAFVSPQRSFGAGRAGAQEE